MQYSKRFWSIDKKTFSIMPQNYDPLRHKQSFILKFLKISKNFNRQTNRRTKRDVDNSYPDYKIVGLTTEDTFIKQDVDALSSRDGFWQQTLFFGWSFYQK